MAPPQGRADEQLPSKPAPRTATGLEHTLALQHARREVTEWIKRHGYKITAYEAREISALARGPWGGMFHLRSPDDDETRDAEDDPARRGTSQG
jgi:hypothetical protein